MALISPVLPTIGQPNSTEDQDVINALTTIVAAINGGLDAANLSASAAIAGTQLAAAAGITAAQLATAIQAAAGLNGASTRRGASVIATSQSTSSASYTTLTTPDRVQNVVVPTNGLLHILYTATWQESVADAARAAIFIGGTQFKVFDVVNAAPGGQAALVKGGTNRDTMLTTWHLGLVSSGGAAYTPVTTGQAFGIVGSNLGHEYAGGTLSTGAQSPGGACPVANLAAGTYDVSIQFKTSSGSVTVKDRKLYVWSQGFD